MFFSYLGLKMANINLKAREIEVKIVKTPAVAYGFNDLNITNSFRTIPEFRDQTELEFFNASIYS